MKNVVTAIMLLMTGCASFESDEDYVNRGSKAYKTAEALYGRDANEEFERNKAKDDLVFYAMEFHLEDECTIPGLTQEEVDYFIDERDIDFRIIQDDVIPFFPDLSKKVRRYYWHVVDDFMRNYNQLVLSEYKNEAYQVGAHNVRKRTP